ncbi:hypothetical protein ACFQ1M_02435 [Sungkyunkwania multivorans]|uniref:Lipoprotein n=1 Tax=Sungkyunkwania multivorans TaxID=1173618 RepID=A0ABW3CTP6_9FLAO
MRYRGVIKVLFCGCFLLQGCYSYKVLEHKADEDIQSGKAYRFILKQGKQWDVLVEEVMNDTIIAKTRNATLVKFPIIEIAEIKRKRLSPFKMIGLGAVFTAGAVMIFNDDKEAVSQVIDR